MSFGDEKELLIKSKSNSNPSINNVTQTEPSPSPPEFKIQPIPKPGGLFSKLKSKSLYSRLPVMNEATPTISISHSEQLPKRSNNSIQKTSQTPIVSNNNAIDIESTKIIEEEDDDEFVHSPESPSIGHLHSTYTSKDDLDLHTKMNNVSNQPRASAVNPISIPLHQSQRQITLDTDFEIPIYKSRTTRSYSQGDQNVSPPSTSPTPNTKKKKEKESFTKNLVVYGKNEGEENGHIHDNTMEDEKKSMDNILGVDEQIAIDIIKKNDSDSKPAFIKNKSHDGDNTDDNISINKRSSVINVFNVKKKTKEQTNQLEKVIESNDKKDKKRQKKQDKKGFGSQGPKGRELKKGKSVFDAFKKEKKVDLSNIKNLPLALKTHLNDDSSDHAIQLILDHIRDIDDQKKDYIYEQIVKDKEFIPRICDKLLSATDAKHNEIVCIWLYDFFNEQNPNARLFALQFIPCLIWCLVTRPPKCVSGVIAALLSLYKKENNIHLSYESMHVDIKNEDVSDLLRNNKYDQTSAQQYGVSNYHNIFPKFEMPDLDLPSIYHEPNTTKIGNQSNNSNQSNIKFNRKNKNKNQKDNIFPSLNQANLSTNLHLIFVALQVFNHYITRVSKPSICLEQMCAVIAKLCSSGIDASQPVTFPDSITSHFAWEWKWYTEDMMKEKQHEKYIIPSPIMSQFLSSIRYSLKQPKTRNIAKFALGQVHKRGHIDMIPEIILQTTSMLHSAFMDGLTF